MSKSFKKHAFHSYDGHKKDKQLRNRINRSRLKQYINTCVDWDSFLLPDERSLDDPWADFDFYCSCPYTIPALNQCQLEAQRYDTWRENYAERYWKFDGEHLGRDSCNCYTNKRSRWWKAKRK